MRCEAPGRPRFYPRHPITRVGRQAGGKICLKAEESFIRQTFGRRPVAVCLANNHIMDYGCEGFNSTMSVLRREGIAYFGAGTIEDNCNNPLVLDIGGVSVGMIGYVCSSAHPICACSGSAGAAPLELSRIERDIKVVKERGVRRTVVFLHWGMEDVHLPRPQDISTAHSIIDLGADLIIGSHSHSVQAAERYAGKMVFYGMGNCIFHSVEVPIITGSGWYIFRYKTKSWNKESLAVTMDAGSMQVTVAGLRFRAGVLCPAAVAPRSLDKWISKSDSNMRLYTKRFERHVLTCKLRGELCFGSLIPPPWRAGSAA